MAEIPDTVTIDNITYSYQDIQGGTSGVCSEHHQLRVPPRFIL